MNKIKQYLGGVWKSWTIWINGIILIGLQFADSLAVTLPIVREHLPPSAYSFLGTLAAINILLRFKTNKSIADK